MPSQSLLWSRGTQKDKQRVTAQQINSRNKYDKANPMIKEYMMFNIKKKEATDFPIQTMPSSAAIKRGVDICSDRDRKGLKIRCCPRPPAKDRQEHICGQQVGLFGSLQ